jgi:hypothetical protein
MTGEVFPNRRQEVLYDEIDNETSTGPVCRQSAAFSDQFRGHESMSVPDDIFNGCTFIADNSSLKHRPPQSEGQATHVSAELPDSNHNSHNISPQIC